MTLKRIVRSYEERIRWFSKQITHADLTDADGEQSFAWTTALPTGEYILVGAYVDVEEQFSAPAGSATAATKVCGNSETYDMAPGDTLVIDVDNGGNQTATWDAAQGYCIDNTYYPIADQDGLTIEFSIDGGATQTVTFSGATTTEAQVRTAINAQLTDVTVTQDTATEKAATKVCGNAETYNMAPGDTLVIDVDNGGNQTATWDAAAATCTDTTSYPVADQDGLTEIVTINGGAAQTVTFSGAHTTAAQIAASMNAQLIGCYVAESGGQVVITTDIKGTAASVAIGAGTCALTWDTPVAGTGDVANIDAVTAAEVETVIEADTDANVTVSGGVPTLVSPTTGASSELDFISGNALAILGLSVETIVGTAAQVKVTSDKYGTDSTVEITGGTSAVVWQSAVDGTGDVADIDAVTAAEIETVIEADTDANVTVSGGVPTIVSPTTGTSSELDFISGNAVSILGLSVETITGSAATAEGTATLDVGVNGGDVDAIIDGADVSTAAVKVNGPTGVACQGHVGGITPCIVVHGSQNLDLFSAGDATVYLALKEVTKSLTADLTTD